MMFEKLRVACSTGQVYDRVGKFMLHCRCFLQANAGVSTVEWVALAAGLVIGSIVVSFIVMQGLAGAATGVVNQLSPSP